MLLLGVLLVQTLTLDGAADGVSYYIGKFDWARLAESEVWAVACGQWHAARSVTLALALNPPYPYP